MFGGIKALDPLKEPFKEKTTVLVKEVIINSAPDMAELTKQSLDIPAIRASLIDMVDQRLGELTPAHVKTIVQDMIRQHLGWLVVWGGVFGGLIGLLMGAATRLA